MQHPGGIYQGGGGVNVKNIVKKYLKDNGYDGLFCDECGCLLDELMPCDCTDITDCEPGYRHDTPDDPDCDWCIRPLQVGE